MNNSIKFASQNYGGFHFGGMYAFSNQAAGFSNNRGYSVGASYAGGTLSAAAAYMQVNHPGTTQGGAFATDDTNFVADRYQVWGGALNYTWLSITAGFVLCVEARAIRLGPNFHMLRFQVSRGAFVAIWR